MTKKNKNIRLFPILNGLLLGALALTMIIPLINVLAVSFTTNLESYENTVKLFPRDPSIIGYKELFKRVAILRPYINNIIVTVSGTFLHILFCSMAGYVLVREKFKGKTLLVALCTIPMMVPFQMIMIPVYVTMRRLGLVDTLYALILTGVISTFSIFLMKN